MTDRQSMVLEHTNSILFNGSRSQALRSNKRLLNVVGPLPSLAVRICMKMTLSFDAHLQNTLDRLHASVLQLHTSSLQSVSAFTL